MDRNANLLAMACVALGMALATAFSMFAVLATERTDFFISVVCMVLSGIVYAACFGLAGIINWAWWKTNFVLASIWTIQMWCWAEFFSMSKTSGTWYVIINTALFFLLRPTRKWNSKPWQ